MPFALPEHLNPEAPKGTERSRSELVLTPCPWRQSTEGEAGHGHANEAQRRVTDRCRHPADLAVAALGKRELDPRRRDRQTMPYRGHTRPQPRRLVDPRGRSRSARDPIECERTVSERCESLIVGLSFHLGEIGALVTVARVGEPVLQPTVGREYHEALGIPVEETGRIEPGFGDELGQGSGARGSRGRKGETGDHVEGLVEHNDPDHDSS